ncbi:MAG: hypothetical protein AAF353_21230 [Pseudomonadota bacterium]
MLPITWGETRIGNTALNLTFLHICLIIATCIPLLLLVGEMLQKYSIEQTLTEISFWDGLMLMAALCLPILILPCLGIKWRTRPEEH